MVSQRQYDEAVMKAAEALPKIAQAITDANTLKCVIALYNKGDVSEAQMDQVLYAVLARKEEPVEEERDDGPRIRYSEEYRKRRQAR